MDNNIIEIHNLKKSYGELTVLKGVDLNIGEGTIHGLVGTSGVGKSTLLRTINGVEEINSGEIIVMGENITNLKEDELRNMRKNISMIFQDFALMQSKNVFENVAFPMKIWNFPEEEISKKVDELLKLVGLQDKKQNKPKNLSGGQRQRVAIARALTLNPKILLSDESTSGLDPVTANNIVSLLLDINKQLGLTIIVVTHQMEIAKQMCDTISIMKAGEIVETGTVEEIFMNYSENLINLIGPIKFEVERIEEKLVYRLFVSSQVFSKPILNILSEKNINYTLEYSQIDNGKRGRFGSFYISVNKEDGSKLQKALSNIEGLVVNKFDPKKGRILDV